MNTLNEKLKKALESGDLDVGYKVEKFSSEVYVSKGADSEEDIG